MTPIAVTGSPGSRLRREAGTPVRSSQQSATSQVRCKVPRGLDELETAGQTPRYSLQESERLWGRRSREEVEAAFIEMIESVGKTSGNEPSVVALLPRDRIERVRIFDMESQRSSATQRVGDTRTSPRSMTPTRGGHTSARKRDPAPARALTRDTHPIPSLRVVLGNVVEAGVGCELTGPTHS